MKIVYELLIGINFLGINFAADQSIIARVARQSDDVFDRLPRMNRESPDYDDDDYEGDASNLESPEMTDEQIEKSNQIQEKNDQKLQDPYTYSEYQPMQSFLSDIFDAPVSSATTALAGRGDRENAEWLKFIRKYPDGFKSKVAPPNLLSDFFAPVYEKGPLVCKKVRAVPENGIVGPARDIPIHVKPIGCCPNNEDGKPFGPGKACCCGHVYNTTSHFCCDRSRGECKEGSWQILEDKPAQRRKCWDTSTCDTEPNTNIVQMSCSDGIHHGSICDFECPSGFDLAGLDVTSCDPTTGNWTNIWGQMVTHTPCCKRQCDTKDPNYKLDFFIILDQSSSIGHQNFDKMKNFVINLLLQSNLGQHGVRVGLITYNRYPYLQFHMNEMENHDQAIKAVEDIEYTGRGTNTGKAIGWTVDNAFKPEHGDRPEVPNKVLLITDGRARDPPVLKVQSKRLQEEATVYALGIGKQIDYVELNRIASPPSERHVLYVDNFSFLERAIDGLREKSSQKPSLSSIFCDEVCMK
jgi:uncharacterized protein YegL